MHAKRLHFPEGDAPSVDARSRRVVRFIAAGLALAIAGLYGLIGLIASNLVVVLDGPTAQVARDQLASEREPAFEAWGVAIRILQVVLLAALVWLAARPPRGADPDQGTPT